MAKLEMNKNTPLEFGLYSLGDHLLNPFKGEKVSYEQRINEIIEASKLADETGIDVFAVGESHQEHFTTQAHTVVLGAIAQATKHIKVSSSSTIISATDPVRVFEVLHQMWWVYNLKNYFKLQLLEFLLLGGQSIIGLGCLLFSPLYKLKIIIIRALKLLKFL